MQSLDKKQLEEIQKLHFDYTQVRLRIADLELQKDAAIAAAAEIRSRMTNFDRKINKKYGEGASINLQTGEINVKD